jgi:hypothetical protein
VADGWLEPLVARIAEDPTRVVVPNIRGFDLDNLALMGGDPWPPNKGIFSWRLSYHPVMAQMDRDLMPGWSVRTSPVRSPVMPGGLFAMSKAFFIKLGKYDPEIKYYGAEHVHVSVSLSLSLPLCLCLSLSVSRSLSSCPFPVSFFCFCFVFAVLRLSVFSFPAFPAPAHF